MTLSIMGMNIRQDASGLYSLNDVHRASGESDHKPPSKWLETSQPREVASLLEARTRIRVLGVKNGGNNPGTFACRELVLMYAACLNTKFYIEVFQAFDFLLQGDTVSASDIALRNSLRAEYPSLTDALRDRREREGKATLPHHYSNEADMINRIVLGMSSKQFRIQMNLPKDAEIRNYIPEDTKAVMLHLQRIDTALMDTGEDFQNRKYKLLRVFNERYLEVA